jgi:hypothetical protein
MQRGQCPEQERLVAFQKGTLADELAGKVKAHVELCSLCQKELRVLEKFERWAEAVEIEEPADWPEIERRGRERFSAFLELRAKKKREPEPAPGIWKKVRAALAHPALAYLLLAALAYPAYRGLFRKPEVVTRVVPEKQIVEKPALDVALLRIFKLKAAERAPGQGLSIVQLRPDESLFALSFFVPISEQPEVVYDVEIRDQQGRLVAMERSARPRDRLGNFLLVCRRDLFSPSEYELQVKEVNKTTQAVTRTFSFLFTVSESR